MSHRAFGSGVVNRINYLILEKLVINNKRHMGQIAHLRKQFKLINTYDYIITLIKRRKKNPIIYFIRIEWPFLLIKLNPHHTRMHCVNLVENGPVILEKKITQFIKGIFNISKLSSLRKGRAVHLNKLDFPSPKDALCQVWLKLVPWFMRRRFLNFVNVFSLHVLIFLFISPLKRVTIPLSTIN